MKVMSLLIQGCSLREGPHHYEITADHYFQLEGGKLRWLSSQDRRGLYPMNFMTSGIIDLNHELK